MIADATVIALAAGFALDLLLGDPRWLPHMVVAIGRVVGLGERIARALFPKTPRGELAAGAALVLFVCGLSYAAAYGAIALATRLSPWAGVALEILICYQALATKCLRQAGAAVYRELNRGDLPAARRAVAGIVGRDTADLGADAVARAAVETVAENASDGVVAPMIFFALGGAPLAVLYKAINTMDSMLGYMNERYRFFGRAAARLDDVANYLPARATALLLCAAAAPAGLDWRGALRVWRRDARNHSSPNAGHPEAACAGALGIRLGGVSRYGGVAVAKPTIGDDLRPVEPDDIRRAGRLLYGAALLGFGVCAAGMAIAARLAERWAPWN